MNIPDSLKVHKRSAYVPYNIDEAKNKCKDVSITAAFFDNMLKKRFVPFECAVDSSLSSHIDKLEYYKQSDHVILTRKDIIDYKNILMEKCQKFRDLHTNNGTEKSIEYRKLLEENRCMLCEKCTIELENKNYPNPKNSERLQLEGKVISLFKEYIIALKFLLAKSKLSEKEVEVFDGIILWMHNFFKKIPRSNRESLLKHLNNSLYNIDVSFTVVIDFLMIYFDKLIK